MHLLIPVKVADNAKSRLAGVLNPEGRTALVLWMLDRVLAASAAAWSGPVYVIGGDASSASIAARYGAAVIPELGSDLNDTLTSALAQVRGNALPAVGILPADLPRLTARDVTALVEASRGGQAGVIAPAHDGDGTNGLLIPAGCVIRSAFGPGSRDRHRTQLEQQGYPAIEVYGPGLAFDVDLPDDLAAVEALLPETVAGVMRIRNA